MFSKLTKVTSTLPSLAKQVVRANQHKSHAKWISTSSGNNRSDVLTQNQQQPNDKLKLEQQERWRMRRTERYFTLFCIFFEIYCLSWLDYSMFALKIVLSFASKQHFIFQSSFPMNFQFSQFVFNIAICVDVCVTFSA